MLTESKRICKLCKIEKDLECFYIENIRGSKFHRTDCKECIKNIKKQYRKNKKNDIDAVCRSMLRGCKKRSTKKKLPQPDFDWKFLKQIYPKDNKCPILGLELKSSNIIIDRNSPTLDRIDPNKPYTRENVVIISNRANGLKSNASYEELKLIFEFYTKILRKQNEENINN